MLRRASLAAVAVIALLAASGCGGGTAIRSADDFARAMRKLADARKVDDAAWQTRPWVRTGGWTAAEWQARARELLDFTHDATCALATAVSSSRYWVKQDAITRWVETEKPEWAQAAPSVAALEETQRTWKTMGYTVGDIAEVADKVCDGIDAISQM